MIFKNTTNLTLEGELHFPVPEAAKITKYGLDVNGKIIDAIPIEKEKAEQIFEQEVISHASNVSIVEQVKGKNFFFFFFN
jgi:Ca-activated chloride channel homolog